MHTDEHALSRREILKASAAGLGLAVAAAVGAHAESPTPRPTRHPIGFVGHGSPMLALDTAKGKQLTTWMDGLARPKAILVVSAHFTRSPATLGATTKRAPIYDFRGFPRELYKVRYVPPGAPALAGRVKALLAGTTRLQSDATRGLDHGAWVPLRWMAPKADIPVLTLSMPTHDSRSLFALGRRLRPLREEGVFILGSGNVTHNLRRLSRTPSSRPPAWASEFDTWTKGVLEKNDVDALQDWLRKAPAARTSHPTVEHFVPLLLVAGARHGSDKVSFPITGFEGGSISRRCVTLASR